MKHIITFLLILGLIYNCAVFDGNVTAKQNAAVSLDNVLQIDSGKYDIIAMDSEISVELMEGQISGDSVQKNFLFFTWGEGEGSAIYKAIRNSNAEGIYIVRKTETQSGFFPIFWEDKTSIKGRGLKFKPLGTKSEKRNDLVKELIYKQQMRNSLIRIKEEITPPIPLVDLRNWFRLGKQN